MNRLLKFWIAKAVLDPKKYGNESLRRTKALHILKGSGHLEMVRILLSYAKIESTVRFLRVPTTSNPIAMAAGGGLQHDKVRRRTNTTSARSDKKLAPLREHSVQL
jgi:hypothetical protein